MTMYPDGSKPKCAAMFPAQEIIHDHFAYCLGYRYCIYCGEPLK